MKIEDIMERVGTIETGKSLAYIKDALEELNKISETHFKSQKMTLNKDQRFYQLPNESIKILDIRCKNHLNDKDEYRSIPRLIYEPLIKDADGS